MHDGGAGWDIQAPIVPQQSLFVWREQAELTLRVLQHVCRDEVSWFEPENELLGYVQSGRQSPQRIAAGQLSGLMYDGSDGACRQSRLAICLLSG